MSTTPLYLSIVWKAAESLTTAEISVTVDGQSVWPVEAADDVRIEAQVDDLLSWLVEFWKPLMLRQTYPIMVSPDRPSQLRSEAEKRWQMQPAEVSEREDELVSAFEDAHDLSRCFAGYFDLAPLWLFRAGERMLIETRGALHSVAFEDASRGLASAGEQIAERLEASGLERWSDLIKAWRLRDAGAPDNLLSWSTGLDRGTAGAFVRDGTLSGPDSVSAAAIDDDELRIAARMVNALPPEQVRTIVNTVDSLGSQPAPDLDEMVASVQERAAEWQCLRAYRQGELAAAYVREKLGLAEVQYLDVFAVVEHLGAVIDVRSVDPPTLDGLAVWGGRRGPAVLLNDRSPRVGAPGDLRRGGAARVTVAHEFCHLLLDRGHTLSAVDVLNSRMPPDVERRAKSFAGELLLPGRVAADSWLRAAQPSDVNSVKSFLRTLGNKYRVPVTVAAWKLEHGLQRRNIDLRYILDLAAPHR